MAQVTVHINGISEGWSGASGTAADIDEAIEFADGSEYGPGTSTSDTATFDLGTTGLRDGDTITNVSITVRVRAEGTAGAKQAGVGFVIGGTEQGARQTTADLATTHANYGPLNHTGWNSDWTQAQIEGAQIIVAPQTTGMPGTVSLYIDCVDVVITYTLASVADQELAGTNPSGWGSQAILPPPPAAMVVSGLRFVAVAKDPVTPTFNPTLAAFRFYNAESTEAGATAFAAQDTACTISGTSWASPGAGTEPTAVVRTVILRVRVQETGGAAGATTDDWAFQYRKDAGSWQAIDAATSELGFGATNAITDKTNGDSTTERLTGGTGSFIAGVVCETTDDVTNFQLTANNYTEFVQSIRLATSVTDGAVFQFRLTRNGSPITSAVTPQITANNFLWDVDAFRFYEDGTESGSTAIAAEDTNISRDSSTLPNLHLRFRIQETGGAPGSTSNRDRYQLLCSKNAGAVFEVNAASTNVQAMGTGSGLTDNANTTNRATEGISDGTGTFVAGCQEEGDGRTGGFNQITANNFSEFVWAITLVDADLANNDTLDFTIRRYEVVTQFDTGQTTTVTPRITVIT